MDAAVLDLDLEHRDGLVGGEGEGLARARARTWSRAPSTRACRPRRTPRRARCRRGCRCRRWRRCRRRRPSRRRWARPRRRSGRPRSRRGRRRRRHERMPRQRPSSSASIAAMSRCLELGRADLLDDLGEEAAHDEAARLVFADAAGHQVEQLLVVEAAGRRRRARRPRCRRSRSRGSARSRHACRR